MKTSSAPPAQRSPATHAELAAEAGAQVRLCHARVGALLSAAEQLLMALTSPPGKDSSALRSAVEELRARRRACEASLLVAQEFADRTLDALETGE